MGPTNVALVCLSKADHQLRAAKERMDSATRNVRIQERRVKDLREKLQQAQSELKESQVHSSALEMDLKGRDEHIEKLRNQQQMTTHNKEYQALLIGINTEKVDRNKVEEELLKEMEAVERGQKLSTDLGALVEAEDKKLQGMNEEIGGRIAELQSEIDALTPVRDEAANAVAPGALGQFERLADRFEGEAMSALSKPDERVEEYNCSACHLSLVVDVYNRLHTRDELVFCPSCQRILFIPEELSPERAVHKPREKRERSKKAPPAAAGRQSSATDVLRSVTVEPDDAGDQGAEATSATHEAPEGAKAENL